MEFILKPAALAFLGFCITYISKTPFVFAAALVPLFPLLQIFAHLSAFKEGGQEALQHVIQFGFIALIPYFCYLGSMYILSIYLEVKIAILAAVGVWFIVAGITVFCYYKVQLT